MARVTLLTDEELPKSSEDLIAKMRTGRRGKLLNIYRMLLHSPALAETWYGHMNSVRWDTQLPGRLRELIIIRIGYILDASYMLHQHIPHLASLDGVSKQECEELRNWASAKSFSKEERSVLNYVDAMTKNRTVADEIFNDAAQYFNDQEMVEITVLVGSYNMHGLVMDALKIDLEDHSRGI